MYNYNIKDSPFFDFNADRMISETELLDINPEYLTTFEENLNKLLQTALTEGLDLPPAEE